MGRCQPIVGLCFDKYSQDALKRISNHQKFAKVIADAIILGVFNSIFTKSGPKTAMLIS